MSGLAKMNQYFICLLSLNSYAANDMQSFENWFNIMQITKFAQHNIITSWQGILTGQLAIATGCSCLDFM